MAQNESNLYDTVFFLITKTISEASKKMLLLSEKKTQMWEERLPILTFKPLSTELHILLMNDTVLLAMLDCGANR